MKKRVSQRLRYIGGIASQVKFEKAPENGRKRQILSVRFTKYHGDKNIGRNDVARRYIPSYEKKIELSDPNSIRIRTEIIG